MKAAVIHGPGDLRVEERAIPEPAAGELLVRTRAASICNATDVHIFEDRIGEDLRPSYPHVLGHERSGEVVAVGESVRGFRVGDRVACWAKMDGAFAEYDVLRPDAYPTVRVDPALSDEAAAFLEFVAATLRTLTAAAVRPGECVVVLGQGVQGLLLALEARLLGARRVVGIDLVAERLERAADLGVDATVNLSGLAQREAVDAVREALGGEADLVVDAAGSATWPGGNSITVGMQSLRWAGRYVMHALPPGDVPINARLLTVRGLTLRGVDVPPQEVRPIMEVGARWAAEGRLPLDDLVTHRVTLDRVEDGLRLCRDRPAEVLKVVVDF